MRLPCGGALIATPINASHGDERPVPFLGGATGATLKGVNRGDDGATFVLRQSKDGCSSRC